MSAVGSGVSTQGRPAADVDGPTWTVGLAGSLAFPQSHGSCDQEKSGQERQADFRGGGDDLHDCDRLETVEPGIIRAERHRGRRHLPRTGSHHQAPPLRLWRHSPVPDPEPRGPHCRGVPRTRSGERYLHPQDHPLARRGAPASPHRGGSPGGGARAALPARLSRRHGRLRTASFFLYGSMARGDDRVGSDVDVLIVLDEVAHYFEELERTVTISRRQCSNSC